MSPSERHLDIGCGDGYFLRRSRCRERIGLDRLFGDDIGKELTFPEEYFDYVTLLAVIEHLENPGGLINEVARILKPSGRFIITTPVRISDRFIRVYAKEMKKQHVAYYDTGKIIGITKDVFILSAEHRFLFGLNQVFVLQKK